jgi:hypothetical protein
MLQPMSSTEITTEYRSFGKQHQPRGVSPYGFRAGSSSFLFLVMEEALQQRRRAQIAQRFLSGEWGVELENYGADQERQRQRDQEFAQ